MATIEDFIWQRKRALAIAPPPSAQIQWLSHLQWINQSRPSNGDHVNLYVLTGESRGTIRVAAPNIIGADDPWIVDGEAVRGVLVNDYVEPGDQAWAPGRGLATVDLTEIGDVHDTGTIWFRGSREPVRIWFRHTTQSVEEKAESSTAVAAPVMDHKVDGLTAQEWKEKWDDLWVALAEEAKERSWCSEYDEFAERNGGPGRSASVSVMVTMVTTIKSEDMEVLLRPLLDSSESLPIGIQSDIKVENEAGFVVQVKGEVDSQKVWDAANEWLQASTYRYDSFDVYDYTVD